MALGLLDADGDLPLNLLSMLLAFAFQLHPGHRDGDHRHHHGYDGTGANYPDTAQQRSENRQGPYGEDANGDGTLGGRLRNVTT
ncbi:hypothetical protein SK1NUM_04760 [Arachnia rubra]|nr:hypothetical protein SK1NUM_04760 [Arachnia rubra]